MPRIKFEKILSSSNRLHYFSFLAISLILSLAALDSFSTKYKPQRHRILGEISGVTYYVSPSGNDTNPGTSTSEPWQTIDRVNNQNFGLGDRILFEGGQTFNGSLYLDQNDIGNTASPIEISTYGTGRATIRSTNQNGFFAYNTSGLFLNNLNFDGDATQTNSNSGLLFYTDLPSDQSLDFIKIDQLDVQAYNTGISLGGWNGKTGYQNVDVTNSSIHDSYHAGIKFYAQQMYGLKNVYIANNRVYRIFGVGAGIVGGSGNGIVLGQVDGSTIEKNIVYENGSNGDANYGIWAYDSNNIAIQHNESYNNQTIGIADGGSYDLDGGVTNSVIQYNYSHDNDGPGYAFLQYGGAPTWSNNTIRYNISQNDAKKNQYGAITIWSVNNDIGNGQIYNNTVYTPLINGNSSMAIFKSTTNMQVRNNIFVTTGGAFLVNATSAQTGAVFQGNDYYSSGSSFKIKWLNTTYSSLTSWRSATNQEKYGTVSTGYTANPQLTNPGNGGTINDPNQLSTLTQYQLKSSSPLINGGIPLTQLGINPGSRDFYGSTIPQAGSYEVGAHEVVPSATPTPSASPTTTPSTTPSPTPTLTPSPTPTRTPTPSPTPVLSIINLTPSADTFSQSNSPSTVNGSRQTVITSGGTNKRTTYLKFNLGSLTNKTIQSAKFRMFVTGGSNGTQTVKNVASTSWSESSLNYSNRPTIGSTITSFVPGGTNSTWYEIDLTSAFVGKGGQIVSFAIDSSSTDDFIFNSKEYIISSLRPVLIITYR